MICLYTLIKDMSEVFDCVLLILVVNKRPSILELLDKRLCFDRPTAGQEEKIDEPNWAMCAKNQLRADCRPRKKMSPLGQLSS
jgi:hypothetical protein